VRRVPVGAADVVEAEPEQERLRPELRVLEREPGGIARSAEIAHRFVVDGRHVGASEIAGAEQAGQFDGVTAIGLDLVAGLLGNQRGRDDLHAKPFPVR
jgi:hypothetical protein